MLILRFSCTQAASSWITSLSSLSKSDLLTVNWTRQPGLSDKQRQIGASNPEAMRFAVKGLQTAVTECRKQFANETWNCTWTNNAFFDDLTPEVSYLHALISGGISHSIAQACADGRIPDCGCGELPQERNTTNFAWGGCSDNHDYGNKFARDFVEAAWTGHRSPTALTAIRNSGVGRKVLNSRMRKRCRCHGLFGACIEKTCKKVVPQFEDYAAVLLVKYREAKKIEVPSVLPANMERRKQMLFADKDPRDLLYLRPSPDYCNADASKGIPGTVGRECFSDASCTTLCCGRGWNEERESRQEQCNCKFVWCCELKCDTCIRVVDRMYCR